MRIIDDKNIKGCQCGAVIEYNDDDIKSEVNIRTTYGITKIHDYILCPKCRHKITIKYRFEKDEVETKEKNTIMLPFIDFENPLHLFRYSNFSKEEEEDIYKGKISFGWSFSYEEDCMLVGTPEKGSKFWMVLDNEEKIIFIDATQYQLFANIPIEKGTTIATDMDQYSVKIYKILGE